MRFTLEPKFDGISVAISYIDHKLVRALTRGDGDAGESILPAVEAMPDVPKILPSSLPGTLEIRGELVIPKAAFEAINDAARESGSVLYKSARNLVAGTVKLKDLGLVPRRGVRLYPWEVVSAELCDSADERLALLVDVAGIPPRICEIAEGSKGIPEALTRMLVAKDTWPFEADGVVIKVDSCSLRRELGMGSKFANFQRAFKAQNAKTETTLLDVIWQVGRQGRLTPVGIVEPVVLAGATIERVMLNNLSWIQEMGIKIGSRVMLMRSGDVIPKIVEVLDA